MALNSKNINKITIKLFWVNMKIERKLAGLEKIMYYHAQNLQTKIRLGWFSQ